MPKFETDNDHLIYAARKGKLEKVKQLLESPDIDINYHEPAYLETPLHAAAANGHLEIVKLLLADPHIKANECDRYGYTPLMNAAYGDSIPVINEILNHPHTQLHAQNERKQTALGVAKHYRREEAVAHLKIIEKASITFFNSASTETIMRSTPHLPLTASSALNKQK